MYTAVCTVVCKADACWLSRSSRDHMVVVQCSAASTEVHVLWTIEASIYRPLHTKCPAHVPTSGPITISSNTTTTGLSDSAFGLAFGSGVRSMQVLGPVRRVCEAHPHALWPKAKHALELSQQHATARSIDT